ncbi:MAG: hypothetical protein KDA80_24685 [Planctomycetaceae bacterium]|nr:hypothetical protein [Planctomycetaceae bacterium]
MEAFVALLLLMGMVWATYRILANLYWEIRGRLFRYGPHMRAWTGQARLDAERDRHRQIQRAQSMRMHNREMQLAILNLHQTPNPDFRRAAEAVRRASDVPVEFRRRQFARLRPQLIQHYRHCLSRGAEANVVAESLEDLVVALGMEPFEADYIRQEVDRSATQRRADSPESAAQEFQNRLTQAQQEHDRRMQVIRSLSTLSEDVRQQLLEAEEQRFQQALFGHESR